MKIWMSKREYVLTRKEFRKLERQHPDIDVMAAVSSLALQLAASPPDMRPATATKLRNLIDERLTSAQGYTRRASAEQAAGRLASNMRSVQVAEVRS